MVNLGVWASGSGLLLGVLNGLAIVELDALDELAEAVGAIEPAPSSRRQWRSAVLASLKTIARAVSRDR